MSLVAIVAVLGLVIVVAAEARSVGRSMDRVGGVAGGGGGGGGQLQNDAGTLVLTNDGGTLRLTAL